MSEAGVSAPARLLHITTVPITLGFLRGQAGYMRAQGIETEAVTSAGEGLAEFIQSEAIPVHQLEMSRRISPLRDLVAVVRLTALLRRRRPDLLHAHTPKGGLLGTVAGRLAGVPVILYHIHGLPLATATGLRRLLLWGSDWLACRLATEILCVSSSVRDEVLRHRLTTAGRITVLLRGSINGVDAEGRFNPAMLPPGSRAQARTESGIPPKAHVVGYVGRLVTDKGLCELANAWRMLASDHPNAHLLLVGPFESHDPLPTDVVRQLQADPHVHFTGLQWDTPRWLAAMDLVVLPSYREGMPVVPLEAAAMALPVVATRVPGCVDAIEHGVTGTLVPVRDTAALAAAISDYLDHPELRERHGSAGREAMLRWFKPERMWAALAGEYRRLLAAL